MTGQAQPLRSRPSASGSLYRTIWRWHFYAGLMVLPFMAWLAVTGGLYLYKPEIERIVYARMIRVAPVGRPLPVAVVIDRVQRQTGGVVSEIDRPVAADESWRLLVKAGRAPARTAWVDPYQGRVLGLTRKGGVMQTVRDLHSLIITGPIGNALIEIVAGWAILLVITGTILWWPRGAGPALGLRGTPRQRVFWRDLHGSVGIVAGAVILFLASTGMPWTGVWGNAVRGYVATHGLGRPAPPGAAPAAMPGMANMPGNTGHAGHDVAETLPWSLQDMAMPHGGAGAGIGVDRAIAIAARHGMYAPWVLSLPAMPGEPYLFSRTIHRAEEGRALYVDAVTGHVLQDARFSSFGPGARWVEWGISTHKGEEYGEPNRLLMLLGCLSVVLLAVSGAVMWWKRRPAGGLGAPARSLDARTARLVAAGMALAGIVFPLTGLSMLAAFLVEKLYRRFARLAPAQASSDSNQRE